MTTIGVLDNADAFALISLGGLTDTDDDGRPNNCNSDCTTLGMTADADDDNDGVLDTADAFSLISLGSLTDTDGDGRPNDCDSDCVALGMTADLDDDNDGVVDVLDAYALVSLGGLTDTDGDGRPNDCDSDCTTFGMTADTDDDNDGVLDTADAFSLISLGSLTDTDGDGRPDDCDSGCVALGMTADLDDDNDGVVDVLDAYALVSLGGLTDTDGDGRPNDCDSDCTTFGMAADTDDDNDGVLDTADAFSLISLGSLTDTDGDGRPNDCDSDCVALGMTADLDDDNDGVVDVLDAYALVSLGGLTDTDGDGRPNDCDSDCTTFGMTADTDDDNDGVLDSADAYPLISLDGLTDTDGDGRPDVCNAACQATGMAVDFDANNDGRLDTLGPIESSFNAHAIALSDHVDGAAKPTFYGLAPQISGTVLGLDLLGSAIDLSHVQATINGESREGESARVLFLLDRVPAAGATGSLTFTISLTDGVDSVVDAGERLFKTSFNTDWSSDGSLVTFFAPIQDQVVNFEQVGTVTAIRARYTIPSVQPSLLTARVPTEFPGYPLALEIQLLELFDDSLVSKLQGAGLYNLVANYFDNGSDYYLSVELDEADASAAAFLGYQGQSFAQIQGQIKVIDVAQSSSDGFNLSQINGVGAASESSYVLNIQDKTLMSETVSQDLFTALCGTALCFESLPGGYLSKDGLVDQMSLSPGDVALSMVAGLSRLPAANENLTYRVTWTEGEDGLRADDEAMITMTVPMTFEPNESADVFTAIAGSASFLRTDNDGCAAAGACEVRQLDLQAAPVSSARPAGGAARALEFDLLPITTRVTGTDGYFDGFFKAGPYHVKVELTGRTGLLSYEQQTITGIEGRFQVR